MRRERLEAVAAPFRGPLAAAIVAAASADLAAIPTGAKRGRIR